MKLSEAIRLGSMLKPQSFGQFFRAAWEPRVCGDVLGLRIVPAATCALGAAWDAVTLEDEMFGDEYVRRFPIVTVTASCPVCAAHNRGCELAGVIVHLNDRHRWTREQIASWVEGIEKEQERAEEANAANRQVQPVDSENGVLLAVARDHR